MSRTPQWNIRQPRTSAQPRILGPLVPSAGGAVTNKVKISGVFSTKPVKIKVSGSFVTKTKKTKIAGAWR